MSLKCSLGFHDWNKNCEKCSLCGKTRERYHDWSDNCEKCAKCGKSRKIPHVWKDDCEKCSNCYQTRKNQHNWSTNCTRCSICGSIRQVKHSVTNGFCNICKSNVITDPRDNHQYKIIKIGNQVLFAENLNYKLNTQGCFSYNNNDLLSAKYGLLYDFESAKLSSNGFPGWHLPTIYEWAELFKFLGELDSDVKYNPVVNNFDGKWLDREIHQKVGRKLALSPAIGFRAPKGGVRGIKGNYERLDQYDYFWSSSENDNNHLVAFAFANDGYANLVALPRAQALSVRFFRD